MKSQFYIKILIFFATLLVGESGLAQSVTINPSSSTGIIDTKSTTRGILPPRMTVTERNTIPLSVGLQVFCTNCTPAGPYSYNGSTWVAMFQTATVSSITYTIGQAAQGGIVFWIDETAQHGLVASTADQSVGSLWYNGNTTTKAVRVGVYGGAYNTEQISNDFGYGSYAAILAAQHSGGQYGDWYLPAINELSLMHTQRIAIGGFAAEAYWSSTEVLVNTGLIADSARQIDFSTGTASSVLKSTPNNVRAIRRF